MRPLEYFVTGVGARGHLGLTALQVTTAARARQLEPRATPFRDARAELAGLARAEFLPDHLSGLARYVALAAPALREAAAGSSKPMPLMLSLPVASRPDQDASPQSERQLLASIGEAARVPLDLDASRVVRSGHAGFAAAALEARERLDGVRFEEAMVGGVDSPCSQAVVTWLEERGWLCREEDDRGRIPAESAAFVRLTKRARRATDARFARLRALEFERGVGEPPGVLTGKLVRRVASVQPRPQWILPDLNGEESRSDAWAAVCRAAADLLQDSQMDDLVQLTGDVGAATGAMLVVLGIVLARTGATRVPSALVVTTSDDGDAGAILVDLPEPGGSFLASVEQVRDHTLGARPGALRPTPDEKRQLDRTARSCLEDMGSMGLLLAPDPVSPQDHPEVFGQRLLDAFDALAALGVGAVGGTFDPDISASIDRYLHEVTPADRARRFAAAFALSHLKSSTRRSTRG